MRSKSIKTDDSILEQKFVVESELVKNESMSILKDFEEIDDFGLDSYSSDD